MPRDALAAPLFSLPQDADDLSAALARDGGTAAPLAPHLARMVAGRDLGQIMALAESVGPGGDVRLSGLAWAARRRSGGSPGLVQSGKRRCIGTASMPPPPRRWRRPCATGRTCGRRALAVASRLRRRASPMPPLPLARDPATRHRRAEVHRQMARLAEETRPVGPRDRGGAGLLLIDPTSRT